MSCNYSQDTIGARRGPLDQYRYGWLHGGVRDKNSKVVLAVLEQRPLPQLPIFSPAVIWLFGSAGILPLRYKSVQKVQQRPI
jgi:hypothetical protein